MKCPSAAGNRNVLLALHFGEARDPRPLRAHVDSCAACREYLASLAAVTEALGRWPDGAPPSAMADRIVAHSIRAPQPKARPATGRPHAGALPLIGLFPIMGALVIAIRLLAGWLPRLPFWPRLEDWPNLQPIVPFVAATAVLLIAGGLAALAAAPALVLETRRQET
jgi:hypothetical protein